MLERFRRRSGSVNLVVHEHEVLEAIRDLEYSGRNPAYLAQLRTVIAEIDSIRKLPNTVVVGHNMPQKVAIDIGSAAEVIVFGCHRNACLKWVSEAAFKEGAAVSISPRGSV